MNKRVLILANDAIHANRTARIAKIDEAQQELLLELDLPEMVEGKKYRYAIARSRLERDDLTILIQKGALLCGVTWIPEERFKEQQPFDLSWWRGGVAAITDVVLEEMK